MAPGRRRGAGKAAAAAAARRQWKVGDLVLAKVKGFPAWPATVSEPQKWGYPADWKKVLVYFFGTQQIAFCNPADVEAFTEEKKQSLLIKRQGKGADFVRAVQEIIDSYEKSKKQDQVDDLNAGQDVTPVNGGNSLESSAHFEVKDHTETSEATVTGRIDSSAPTCDTQNEAPNTSLDDKETIAEQSTDGVVVTGKPIITTSRKRSGGLRSRKLVTQEKVPAVERSRNSSRLDSYRCQNFLLPCDGNKTSGDVSSNIIRNASLRRNKRIKRSSDAPEWDDVDSSAFASNGSIEDNGSEIVTVDSDSFSLNEGSGVDSGCKLEHSETVVQCLEGDVELGKGLDFQIKAVVIKKKRKLNRKRVTNEASEPTSRQEIEADLEVGVHNSSQDSQNASESLSERYNREDGDEHLPLVKRARVRMSKSSSTEEENNIFSQAEAEPSNEIALNLTEEHSTFCQAEERTSDEAAAIMLEQFRSSANCSDDFPTDKNSFSVIRASDNASPPKDCTQFLGNRPQLPRVKENQSLCCSADGEAALPPSKRLHRALEAMSANAAEEGIASVDAETSTRKTVINDGSTSSMATSSIVDVKSQVSNGSGEQCVHGDTGSLFCASSTTVLEESIKSSLEGDPCNQPTDKSCNVEEHCENVFAETRDQDESKDQDATKDPSETCFGANAVCGAVQAPSPVDLTPNSDRRPDGLQSSQCSSDQLLPNDEGNSGSIQLKVSGTESPYKKLDSSEQLGMSLKHIEWNTESAKVAFEDGINGKNAAEGTVSENTESLRSQIDENSQANNMHKMVKDIKYEQEQKEATYASTSEDHLGDKDVLGRRSSPFPAVGVDTPSHTCLNATSLCHVSTSESTNCNQSSSYTSPNTHLDQKKPSVAFGKNELTGLQRPKSVGKGSTSAESHTALSSFEGLLGSLTRTKESIGRATRMAIDCAKLGVSAKVVEILARNLENESSLHRRVDLFFLVDSITQCSRGLKGDVGGIYPSAIQAVLPRLLSAAAPPGSFAVENRRQCLKVLRLWLERRVLPESVIRHHMRELNSLNFSSSSGVYSRRSARTERALDDPVRDMEGMLVDEYGSNSSFQLPGFCMPRMLKDEDEGTDSDGGSFEAVTPEHNFSSPEEREITSAVEKHTHILEDVDGELEMEDVAPSCEEVNSASCSTAVNGTQNSLEQLEERLLHPFAPPLPQDVPPLSPPLPSSPPPPAPPPPPPPPTTAAALHSCSLQDDLRQSSAPQSIAPGINSSMPNSVHYPGPKCRDQLHIQHCDSSSSFSSYPVHPANNVQCRDGPGFHHKAYPPRPPQPPPSNQFSYVHTGQNMKSRRDTQAPHYSHRFHSSHNVDGGNFYSNHERMRPDPYEPRENWRYHAPPLPGPRYHDKPKASYAPVQYGGPAREPTRLPHHEWGYPPRETHHRMHFRPPPEDAVPVANRAHWRPR